MSGFPWQPCDKATYIRFVVLQQVTYCCAGLSAGLEKPFKQDNLSVFFVTVAHKQNTETKGLFDWSYIALLHGAERRKQSQIQKPAPMQIARHSPISPSRRMIDGLGP